MSTPPGTRAPSPAPVETETSDQRQAAALSDDDEYDQYFDDDEVFRLHDELTAASALNDGQSGATYVFLLSLTLFIY